ncbi:MAG: NAD(P)H-hydrate dehydratase [Treponema sp.]|nr:NAD(P)H-hydrate dehydratase [Treponema sp.]
MREIEQIAVKELGIPSIILMENAAIRTAEHCIKKLNEFDNPRALIVCGQGNNGGDGFAIARHLRVKGIDTNVIFTGDIKTAQNQTSGAAVNLAAVQKLGIPVISDYSEINFKNYDLIVDAIFGTGLTRDAEGIYKNLIDAINNCAKYVISVDIPSGLHSDTGRIMGSAVKASETVTFGFPKTGLFLYPGAEYAGKIHIEDISIPGTLIERVETKTNVLTESEAVKLLPVRKRRSNKGSFGKVLVFAGSNEMPGAASLSCSAAYMTGCGLVCACVTQKTASVIHRWQREIVTRITPEKNGMYCKESLRNLSDEIKNASVIIAGPGIGRSDDVSEFVFELLNMAQVPVVLDADALFAVSENVNILKTLKSPCVITPHPGEMSRLTSLSVPEILDDITGAAEKFAKDYNVVTLLKDAHTVIASPGGAVNINITGNSSLSKAGTGDVLTGMIAGFIAQSAAKLSVLDLDVFTASILGAYFHGKAGEAACLKKSHYSVTASDVIDQIPVVMKK